MNILIALAVLAFAVLLTVRRYREKRQGTDVSPAERIVSPLLFAAAFAALLYSILP